MSFEIDAKLLIKRGHKKHPVNKPLGDPEYKKFYKKALNKAYDEQNAVENYCKKITASDVCAALDQIEFGDVEEQQYSGKMLLAYLNWCDRNGIEAIPEGKSVDHYLLRLSKIILKQACGHSEDGPVQMEVGEDKLPINDLLPMWQLPQMFVDMTKKSGRPKGSRLNPPLIFLYHESLQSIIPQNSDRKKKVAKTADCSVRQVEMILKDLDPFLAHAELEFEENEHQRLEKMLKDGLKFSGESS